jgi:hypothetical protein
LLILNIFSLLEMPPPPLAELPVIILLLSWRGDNPAKVQMIWDGENSVTQ